MSINHLSTDSPIQYTNGILAYICCRNIHNIFSIIFLYRGLDNLLRLVLLMRYKKMSSTKHDKGKMHGPLDLGIWSWLYKCAH